MHIELTDEDAAVVREVLEAQLKSLLHEIHHADDREFRDGLKNQHTQLEAVLKQLESKSGVS